MVYVAFSGSTISVKVEKQEVLHFGKQILTVDWLPVEKRENEDRSIEEYFDLSKGNCVIGSKNGGVYVMKISFLYFCLSIGYFVYVRNRLFF